MKIVLDRNHNHLFMLSCMALSHLEFSAIPLIQQCLTRDFVAASQPSKVSIINFSNISRLCLALCVSEET